MTDPKDDMLDDLFAEARVVSPEVSDDLMTRVLADAAASQRIEPPRPEVQGGAWGRLLDMIGGWPAASGLAAATIAGVWIGIAPPAAVEELTAGLLGDTVTISLVADSDLFDLGGFGDG